MVDSGSIIARIGTLGYGDIKQAHREIEGSGEEKKTCTYIK